MVTTDLHQVRDVMIYMSGGLRWHDIWIWWIVHFDYYVRGRRWRW